MADESMKGTAIRLGQQYEAALGNHLRLGSLTGLTLARRVGKRAAALGLRALDLARLHDRAFATFGPSPRDGAPRRADAFFAEALAQLEQKSPSGRKTAARWRELNKQLRQRTMDLATSRRIRKKDLVDRNVLRDALKKKTAHYASLLAESRDLQRCLQRLTRRMLSAQENERTTISRTLRDDVAQAMLGIQVKLAHLKTEAARNTTGLRKELTATQRLVEKSTKTLEQFAGKLG